ncbi:hypothetical protein ACFL2H_04435 [Planctomycetota bacterium]
MHDNAIHFERGDILTDARRQTTNFDKDLSHVNSPAVTEFSQPIETQNVRIAKKRHPELSDVSRGCSGAEELQDAWDARSEDGPNSSLTNTDPQQIPICGTEPAIATLADHRSWTV